MIFNVEVRIYVENKAIYISLFHSCGKMKLSSSAKHKNLIIEKNDNVKYWK